jgi:hypothetical protein
MTRDGIAVRVEIYRIVGSGEGWSLEVVDQDGGSTVWSDLFATGRDANAEFTEPHGRHSLVCRKSGSKITLTPQTPRRLVVCGGLWATQRLTPEAP